MRVPDIVVSAFSKCGINIADAFPGRSVKVMPSMSGHWKIHISVSRTYFIAGTYIIADMTRSGMPIHIHCSLVSKVSRYFT